MEVLAAELVRARLKRDRRRFYRHFRLNSRIRWKPARY
jgi:hypothetical protein